MSYQKNCPICNSTELKFGGIGIEQVEEDLKENLSLIHILHFMEHYFEEPKYSIKEAKLHKVNYSRSLKVHVALENKETGEFKDDTVFMGELPIMTPWGTFIFNGSERVVVTQIVRSAGVFFSEEVDKKSGQSIFSGQIIPCLLYTSSRSEINS